MNEKKDTMIKDAIILCLITVILGAILAGVYSITKKPIEDAQAKANAEACEAVVAEGDKVIADTIATGGAITFMKTHTLSNKEATEDTDPQEILSNYVEIKEIHRTENGGMVFIADALKGYGGKISFALGIDNMGLTTGISITDQSETAGLGAKCKEPEFAEKFKNLYIEDMDQELYTKDEVKPITQEYTDSNGQQQSITFSTKVQAITGATVTSRAITRAVKGVIYYYIGEGAMLSE